MLRRDQKLAIAAVILTVVFAIPGFVQISKERVQVISKYNKIKHLIGIET